MVYQKMLIYWEIKALSVLTICLAIKTFVPKKKQKNGFLTPEEKEDNSLISSIRIKVEHAIGGVKRLGVATNIFRGRFGSDDRFTFVSAALWNFHLQYAA